ncbi:MAG: hypothetical protein AAFW60_00485 [Pseudomonadota bacterium]
MTIHEFAKSFVAKMSVNRDGTGGEPKDGDPVGRMEFNGTTAPSVAPSDSQRPLYRGATETHHRLEFDNVDDALTGGGNGD